MTENRKESASETGQQAIGSCNERFTPTCKICGKKHWPLSPLCIGKKRAKAEAKAKAKAEKLARAEAKARAKAERKARGKVKGDAKAQKGAYLEEVAEVKRQLETESAVRGDLEAKLRLEAEEREREKEEAQKMLDEERQARARIESELAAEREERARAQERESEKEEAREMLDEERQARAKIEAELAAEKEERARAEEKALEYARQREEVRQWAILAEQAKLTAEERLRVETQERSRMEAEAEVRMRAEAEAMARVEPKAAERVEDAGQEDGVYAQVPEEPCRNRVAALLELRARDIMQRDVTWCSPEESIEVVLVKMRRGGCDYVIVGKDGVAEGIVARSELKGRLNSHVRRAMGKWKQRERDTTLWLQVKFAMIRGVETIGEETSVTTIMKNMRQSGCRALPVVDEHGRVTGLVTACNVLKVRVLLRLESNPHILAAKGGQTLNLPGVGKTGVRVFEVFRPSGVSRGVGKNLKSQISS